MAGRKSAKDKAKAHTGEQIVLTMRFPRELVEEVDQWMENLNDGHHGPQWSRTAIVRATLARAVRERAPKGEEP